MGKQEREINVRVMDCAIAEWELERYRENIEDSWQEEINSEAFLDKNRYQKLALALRLIDKNYVPIFDINDYIRWIITYENPTGEQLKMAAEKSRIFQHVLSWDERMKA